MQKPCQAVTHVIKPLLLYQPEIYTFTLTMDKLKNETSTSGRSSRSTSSRKRRQKQQQQRNQHRQYDNEKPRQTVGRKIVSFLIPGEGDPRLSTASCHGQRSPSPTSVESSTSNQSRISGILKPSKHGSGGNSSVGGGGVAIYPRPGRGSGNDDEWLEQEGHECGGDLGKAGVEHAARLAK